MTRTLFVAGSRTADGEDALPPDGKTSVLFSAAVKSIYPAPTVNMSYWLVYAFRRWIDGRARCREEFLAVFISLALTVSGVSVQSFVQHNAAAPLTMGAAMLVR